MAGLPAALVVLEATGGYEASLAADLAAALLALFAERIRPEPRPVPDAQAQALAELVARRRQVVEMIVMEGNRRRCARDPKVRAAIDATLAGAMAETG